MTQIPGDIQSMYYFTQKAFDMHSWSINGDDMKTIVVMQDNWFSILIGGKEHSKYFKSSLPILLYPLEKIKVYQMLWKWINMTTISPTSFITDMISTAYELNSL